jgi:hypothetical protein
VGVVVAAAVPAASRERRLCMTSQSPESATSYVLLHHGMDTCVFVRVIRSRVCVSVCRMHVQMCAVVLVVRVLVCPDLCLGINCIVLYPLVC